MAGKPNDIPATTALELLQAGNERYVADLARRPNATPRRRLETGGGQWPFAIVLTCADSRVTPEMIFDQGIGDIFVARVAGNVASDEVIGSIQYAVNFIGTELVVVLGHEACGAVGAALDPPAGAPKELGNLVGSIQDAIRHKPGKQKSAPTAAELQKAVEKNVKAQVSTLKNTLKGGETFKVVPACYGLRTGAVSWL